MGKRKRKSKAPQPRVPAPSERRQLISYDDVQEGAAPPIPRQKVSYATDSDSDHDAQQGEPSHKRHAVVSQQAIKERGRPQMDVNYGQMGAFPGLDTRDEEPFYGPANDGLDYLRMVRSEARGIPHIVTAPPPAAPTTEDDQDVYDDENHKYPDEYNEDYPYDDYEDEEGYDEQGWYEDGAYVARSTTTPTIGPIRPGKDPQNAFYDTLKTRFSALRRKLHTQPSLHAVHALDDDHPITLPFANKAAEKEWRNHLQHTTPLSAQLASLDLASTLRLLKLAEGQLENCRKTNIPHTLSLWIWGLLAKLEDVGLLQTREVGVVRELAKMGLWVRMMHHRAKYGKAGEEGEDYLEQYPDEQAGWEQEDESGAAMVDDTPAAQDEQEKSNGNHDGDTPMDLSSDPSSHIPSILAAKKAELLAEAKTQEPSRKREETQTPRQEPSKPSQAKQESPAQQERDTKPDFPDTNTTVTIDMLVTIAADFYGQKDLLVGRLAWDGQEKGE